MVDGKIIHQHRGTPDKYTYADKTCDIYERLAQLPPYGDVFQKLETQTNKKVKDKNYKMKISKDNICYESSDDDDFEEDNDSEDGTSSWTYSIYYVATK